MFDLLANLFSHEEELSQVVPVIKAEDTISEVCSSGDEVFSMPPRFVRKTSNHVCVPDDESDFIDPDDDIFETTEPCEDEKWEYFEQLTQHFQKRQNLHQPLLVVEAPSETSSDFEEVDISLNNVFCVPDESESEPECESGEEILNSASKRLDLKKEHRIDDFEDFFFEQQRIQRQQKQRQQIKNRVFKEFKKSVQEELDSRESQRLQEALQKQKKRFNSFFGNITSQLEDELAKERVALHKNLQEICRKQDVIFKDEKERERAYVEEKSRKEKEARDENEARQQAALLILQAEEAEKQRIQQEKAVAEKRAMLKKMGFRKKFEARVKYAQNHKEMSKEWKKNNRKKARQFSIAIGKTVNRMSATKTKIAECCQSFSKIVSQSDPESLTFVMHTMADTFIGNCTKKISLNLKLSYTYGWILFGLCTGNKIFTNTVLCVLTDKCPYTLPWFPLRSRCESTEEYLYLTRRGPGLEDEDHAVFDEKIYETEEMYFDRIKGCVGLYCGFIDINHPNHPKPKEAEKFLTRLMRVLNYPVLPAAVAPCVATFLEIAAFSINTRYSELFMQFYQILKQSLPKFPTDTPMRLQYRDLVMLHIEKIEKGELNSPPEAANIQQALSVGENDIDWSQAH